MFFTNYTEISEAIYLGVTMIALVIAAMAALISILFALFSIVCAAWDSADLRRARRQTETLRQTMEPRVGARSIGARGHF